MFCNEPNFGYGRYRDFEWAVQKLQKQGLAIWLLFP